MKNLKRTIKSPRQLNSESGSVFQVDSVCNSSCIFLTNREAELKRKQKEAEMEADREAKEAEKA